MVASPSPGARVVKLMLRLPNDLHASLVESARREQRSLNGQIVYLLRKAIEQQPA